jgi:hypothetical protein
MLLANELPISPPPVVGGVSPVPDLWLRTAAVAEGFRSHSYDSNMDLAMLVSDFLENGASAGGDSRASSDSDSALSDLAHLADQITVGFFFLDFGSTLVALLYYIMSIYQIACLPASSNFTS